MHFEEIGEKIKGHSLIYFTRPDGFSLKKNSISSICWQNNSPSWSSESQLGDESGFGSVELGRIDEAIGRP
jgi:hypothetical protein